MIMNVQNLYERPFKDVTIFTRTVDKLQDSFVLLSTTFFQGMLLFGTNEIARKIQEDDKYSLPLDFGVLFVLYFITVMLGASIEHYIQTNAAEPMFIEISKFSLAVEQVVHSGIGSTIGIATALYVGWLLDRNNKSTFVTFINIVILALVFWVLISTMKMKLESERKTK